MNSYSDNIKEGQEHEDWGKLANLDDERMLSLIKIKSTNQPVTGNDYYSQIVNNFDLTEADYLSWNLNMPVLFQNLGTIALFYNLQKYGDIPVEFTSAFVKIILDYLKFCGLKSINLFDFYDYLHLFASEALSKQNEARILSFKGLINFEQEV